jgi:hypothetical protein
MPEGLTPKEIRKRYALFRLMLTMVLTSLAGCVNTDNISPGGIPITNDNVCNCAGLIVQGTQARTLGDSDLHEAIVARLHDECDFNGSGGLDPNDLRLAVSDLTDEVEYTDGINGKQDGIVLEYLEEECNISTDATLIAIPNP